MPRSDAKRRRESGGSGCGQRMHFVKTAPALRSTGCRCERIHGRRAPPPRRGPALGPHARWSSGVRSAARGGVLRSIAAFGASFLTADLGVAYRCPATQEPCQPPETVSCAGCGRLVRAKTAQQAAEVSGRRGKFLQPKAPKVSRRLGRPCPSLASWKVCTTMAS